MKPEYYHQVTPRSIPTAQLFFELFGQTPNVCDAYYLDKDKIEATLAFLETEQVREVSYIGDDGKPVVRNRFYIGKRGIVELDLDGSRADLAFYYPDSEKEYLPERVKAWAELRINENEPRVHLLGFSDGDFQLTPFEIKPPQIDVALVYGEDFLPVNERILARLSEKKSKGLVILYGPPGTGKTTYLRYLIGRLAEESKKIVYLPPDVAKELASPSFLPFLTHHPDSILIIEDAENIVRERSGQSHQAVANLLNLSDGILSDCLSIQVVCSFNSDLTRVDPALMRKGRLIAKHYFDKIPVERAKKIVEKEGLNFEVAGAMTLAEIYYHHDGVDEPQKVAPIGFGKH